VGAYYAAGFKPVNIWVTIQHVRAVRGGVGEAKTPGNYAASLYAAERAAKEGYSQVLWLDGVEHQEGKFVFHKVSQNSGIKCRTKVVAIGNEGIADLFFEKFSKKAGCG